MPWRYRLRCYWLQACILAFWYNPEQVEKYATELEKFISFGTLPQQKE